MYTTDPALLELLPIPTSPPHVAQVQAVPAGISPVIHPPNLVQVPEPNISLVAFLLVGIVLILRKKPKHA